MNYRIISDAAGLAELSARVRAAPRVALDTEFHNERAYTARLMVMQIAFADEVAVIDAPAVGALSPLIEALAETLVVGHALSGDFKIFADRFDRVPARAFDTQVAAAFCGYGLSVSLAELVRDMLGVRLKKTQTVSDWSARPLSPMQLEYLVDDVAHLLDLQDGLSVRLESRERLQWALEEFRPLGMLEHYRIDPHRAYLRIPGANRMNRRELGILSELTALRDSVARRRDVPLRYVLGDDVLAGLATLRPKTQEDLSQLRRLDAGARRSLGNDILAAVARGEAIPEADLPQKPARPVGVQREGLVAAMSVLVATIARANELPASLLVPRNALERIARELPSDREALAHGLDLTAWRAELIVDPLWELLSGRRALRIEGYAQRTPQITCHGV
ncbi:MAG: ribonuclease D [Candidatus Eremiobacteraeota bacterium]|nr:ribonuclease D [Candidatus Eremiobacteraeota bacterium]